MDNHRHIKLLRKLKLAHKPLFLYLRRDIIGIVIIKTDFADSANLRIGGKNFKHFHIGFGQVARFAWVHTDRRVYKIVFFGKHNRTF